MKKMTLMAVGGLLSAASFVAFAECAVVTCDPSKDAAFCESETAAYNVCVDREAQQRWSAKNVGNGGSNMVADANSRQTNPKTDTVENHDSEDQKLTPTVSKQEAASAPH